MAKEYIKVFVFIMSISHSTMAFNASQTCGTMSESSGLIQGGQLSNRDQFPWITHIFTKPTQDFGTYIFAGTGTLISDHHILCAANSVSYENYLEDTNTLNPEKPYVAYSGKNVKLKLGAKNFRDTEGEAADSLIIKTVQRVKLHPQLRGNRPRIANIAILRVRQAITFTQFIKPACIWSDFESHMRDFNNRVLFAVGHGLDFTGTLSALRKQIPMTTQNDEICRRFYKNSFKTDSFFCAKGTINGTACKHDKSLYQKINGNWYLRAMSSMFKIFRNNTCSLNAPVLYEDMDNYSHWIIASMN